MNQDNNIRAGGCLWMVAIIVGALGGMAFQNPMAGVLLGTTIGGLIALAVWLIDRARKKR